MMNYKRCPACSGHAQKRHLSIRSQSFLLCSQCRTLWLRNGPQFNNYDSIYIRERGHDESSLTINKSKARTFRKFWSKLGKIGGPVLEVGCSTGISLKVALDIGYDVYGLDVNESLPEIVERQGIPRKRISLKGLNAFYKKKFVAVAFFDSFEHLPDPNNFLSELLPYLSDGCVFLIVIPNAGSISRKLLGRYWPHYGVDHWVHYTLKGLKTLFSKYRIRIVNTFYPSKYVSMEMIIRHAAIHWNFPKSKVANIKGISSITLRFNIGEMGLACRYKKKEVNINFCS